MPCTTELAPLPSVGGGVEGLSVAREIHSHPWGVLDREVGIGRWGVLGDPYLLVGTEHAAALRSGSQPDRPTPAQARARRVRRVPLGLCGAQRQRSSRRYARRSDSSISRSIRRQASPASICSMSAAPSLASMAERLPRETSGQETLVWRGP